MVLFVGVVGAVAPVQAGSPEKLKKIEQAIQLSGAIGSVDVMIEPMLAQYIDALRQGGMEISPGLSEDMQKTVARVMRRNYPNLVTRIVGLYDQHFSDEEIDQMITFWKSPIGRKVARLNPVLTERGMVIGQQWGMALQGELEKEITPVLKKYSH